MIRRILYPLVLVALTLYLLLTELLPYVQETAELTPFYLTDTFGADMLHRVGGGVFYVASLLQSCFALPWLGTLLLCGVLAALAYSLKWALRLSDEKEGFCWLPSAALLLNYTQTGYLIYLLKSPAVAFTAPVGMLVATWAAGGWMRMNSWKIRILWIVIISTVGFWLMGVYALLACGMVVLAEMADFRRSPISKQQIALLAGLVVCSLLLPRLLYSQGCFMMRVEDLYRAGLPDFCWNTDEKHLYYPLLVAFVVTGVLSLVRRVAFPRWMSWCSLAVLAVSAIGCWHYSFRDDNFLSILRMKHEALKGDYEAVIEQSRTATHEPTRTEIMLTRLALYETGRMGDELFLYQDGDAAYRSPRPAQYMRLMAAHLLYYYYGKVNYAYRWSMEDMVEYGHRPYYLKCMARCALLNGESRLAQKYLDELGHTLWYRDFASKYMPYTTHPERVKTDGEMSKIQPLLQYGDVLDGDGGLIEMYLLNSFAYTEGGSRPIVELSLMNNLITKNIQAAWPRLMMLLPTWHGHIPRHYQEAALLIGQLSGGRIDTSLLPIDGEVRQEFNELIQASAQNGDDAANSQLLRPKFGGTYWYYYFFINGLKTN